MERKPSTPMREIRRKYEETHKEQRKQTNGQFSTFIPRKDFEEMNAFLKAHHLTKVDLIFAGYEALRDRYEPRQDGDDNADNN